MSRLSIDSVADVRFGGLQEFSLDGLGHGFVVVSGPNEAGKSTLAEFIAWMIAGPIGNTADAARFGDTGSVIGGRLLGTVGDEELDLAGAFLVLGNGAPKDSPTKDRPQVPRQGTLGGVGVDGPQLLVRLGALTPAAFDLLYRIGSETAHLLGSESDLVALFTRYATGSINSSVDFRTTISALEADLKDLEKKINGLSGNKGRRAEVRSRLDEALARPGRLRDIEHEIGRLEDDRSEVGRTIAAAAERLGDLRIAIEVSGRDGTARAAERALADARDLPGDVASIAADLDAVVDLAARLDSARSTVAAHEPDVTAACRAVGVDAATLAGHSLTNADKQAFRDAASDLSAKRRALAEAEAALARHGEDLRVARDHAETCLSHGSLDRGVLTRRILDVDKVSALGNPAVAVDQALRDVGQRERALEDARLNARDVPGDVPAPSTGGTWRSFLPALLGVLGAILGAVVHPVAAAAGGVVGLAVGLVVVRSGGPARTVIVPAHGDPVAGATTELERARLALTSKLAELNQALEGLGLPHATAEGAVDHMADLVRALKALAEVRRLESLTASFGDAVSACGTGVSVAETTYGRLFVQRGLLTVSEEGLGGWLDAYSDGIGRAAEHVRLVEQCEALAVELAAKTRGVARLADGSSPAVVAERAREYIEIRNARAALAKDAADRRNEADIAMGNRAQVRVLLESGNTEMLDAEARAQQAEIDALEKQRSDIDGRLGSLRTELAQKSEGELVADLTEELGRIEDDIDELVREYAVLAAALESIQKVVGEYELRNQGPVIEAAQNLIASVDPAFGSLYVDRSDGDPQLMVDRSGRRVQVQRLSTGARALVYFALRLAFQTVDSKGRPVALPLICDDPLVTIDDRRIEPILRLLQKVSEERQVIYLTCHDREARIAAGVGARVVALR